MLPMNIHEEHRVDTRQAAERLGVSIKTMQNIRLRGELRGEQVGTGTTAPWFYDRRDVERLAEARTSAARKRAQPVRHGLHIEIVVDRDLVDDMPATLLTQMLGDLAYGKIQKLLHGDEWSKPL